MQKDAYVPRLFVYFLQINWILMRGAFWGIDTELVLEYTLITQRIFTKYQTLNGAFVFREVSDWLQIEILTLLFVFNDRLPTSS